MYQGFQVIYFNIQQISIVLSMPLFEDFTQEVSKHYFRGHVTKLKNVVLINTFEQTSCCTTVMKSIHP